MPKIYSPDHLVQGVNEFIDALKPLGGQEPITEVELKYEKIFRPGHPFRRVEAPTQRLRDLNMTLAFPKLDLKIDERARSIYLYFYRKFSLQAGLDLMSESGLNIATEIEQARELLARTLTDNPGLKFETLWVVDAVADGTDFSPTLRRPGVTVAAYPDHNGTYDPKGAFNKGQFSIYPHLKAKHSEEYLERLGCIVRAAILTTAHHALNLDEVSSQTI